MFDRLRQLLCRLSSAPTAGAALAVSVSPILIGGTGGSGTRVVQEIVERSGVFMGRNLNESRDALDCEAFLDRTINPVLEHTRTLDYTPEQLPPALRMQALEELRTLCGEFLADAPHAAPDAAPQARTHPLEWGLKTPRIMFVLPLVHALYPQMRFVHVVRDGRDMALSGNRNQPRKHYSAMFSQPLHADQPDADWTAAALALWARANGSAADWAERTLGQRYLRVRFEDICQQPDAAIRQISSWIGHPDAAAGIPASVVQPPESLGRWRSALPADPTPLLEETHALGPLRRFGYA